MSENIDNRRQTRRLSSILKTVVVNGDSPTQTFNRRSKRISFSHVNNVKEFVADGNNRTIWGESYEKGHTVTDASSGSSGSAQTLTTDSVAQTLTTDSTAQTIAINVSAPAYKIDLFAGIEDDSHSDVEMDVSLNESQSLTKVFNETMYVEEPLSPSVTNWENVDMSVSSNKRKTIETITVTNCETVDMSVSSNKRKTIETITMDKVTTDVMKSVKIRRMNDENVDPSSHNTILHDVNMSVSSTDSIVNPEVNLNRTRMFDGDADLSDVDHLPQSKLPTHPTPSTISYIGASNILGSTSVSEADITIGNQPNSTTDTFKPIANKTCIFGFGDITGSIEQTFAVRNPLQENNNVEEWNSIDKSIDSGKHISKDSHSENNVATFEHNSGYSQQRTLEDLTISMDTTFKSGSLSPNSLNADEPAIEDLTIFLDTNFKAQVSGENDSAMESMEKFTESISGSATKNYSLEKDMQKQKSSILSHAEPSSMVLSNHIEAKIKENLFVTQPSASAAHISKENAHNLTSKMSNDMTLNAGAAVREKILSPGAHSIRTDLTNVKAPVKTAFWDPSASHDQVPETDFTFAYADPLSSTRFLPSNKSTHLSDDDINIKGNSSSVTFNYCPTLTTRQSRSAASLQNNTDELCNLEPDQLKRQSEMKNLFLSLSESVSNDMLSETKMDLVDESVVASIDDDARVCSTQGPSASEFLKQNVLARQSGTNSVFSNETKATVSNEQRCRKCVNCRKSIDGNSSTYLRKDEMDRPKLDFSMYDQFKGLPTLKDVIEAQKKREAARELEEQLLVDQNVDAPDIVFLWLNKNAEENTGQSQPVYVPEPIICYPMLMDINFLMRNKLRTEYTQWKYNDNFFFDGAVALRHEKIPSIRIHIKFDSDGPKKAEELNMPLLFTRVFIEECSTYLRRVSPGNFLKHKHAIASLPTNLKTMLSDSSNIYGGLEEIENCFQRIEDNVEKIEALTVIHDAKFVLDNGQCFIEQTIFDTQTYWMQEFGIKLDKIDSVGPQNVIFRPTCQTTAEFKALPNGLPFLRLFLANPKAYLVPDK